MRLLAIGIGLLMLSGCTSYGVIENSKITDSAQEGTYSIKYLMSKPRSHDEITLNLAFSGGGTRAAALAYGVLLELSKTQIRVHGEAGRLLDEVDGISSVSGGSFTSAYYGLHGDKIFEDFESVFLRKDIEGKLLHGLFNPALWFSSTGRTEMAVKYYEDVVFHGATFADMKKQDGPLILINASDLGYGVRFSFVQEYFNLLCSDIDSFPVARAVTASSAVPVLFNPVVVENYQHCKGEWPQWLVNAEQIAEEKDSEELKQVVEDLKTYFLKENRQYAHFVDGGITDNLGLRALYDLVELTGGADRFLEKAGRLPPKHVAIISVNASTDPEPLMDKSNEQPSLEETINAITDIQLHRYNTATLGLMEATLERWTKAASTEQRPVNTYFIQIGFRDLAQEHDHLFFNTIPTSFSLTDEQVDRLIAAGGELLRNNAEYQRFLTAVNSGN